MRRYCAFSLLVLWIAFPTSSPAADRPLDFLHALQEAGFGDTAVEYLQSLEKNKNIPDELKKTWDLELSESYDVGARNAFDDKEATRFRAESTKYLNKFLKENPDHPDASKAILRAALQLEKKGLEQLTAAKNNTNKEQAEKSRQEARAAFEEAKPRFVQAHDKLKAKLASLPKPVKNPKTQEEKKVAENVEKTTADWLDARFQIALLDLYIARTIGDPKDPKRTAMLALSSKEFNAIYQFNRENVFGLASHMWQGKAEEELGNVGLANDILEEVLGSAPDPKEATPTTVLDDIFANVEYEHLVLLLKQKKETEFFTEAKEWLDGFRKNRRNVTLNYFQGVSLEYAKALIPYAAKATGANKTKAQNEALNTLRDMAKVRSDFQGEAIKLLREINKTEGQDPKTFDEAKIAAENSFRVQEWAEAIKFGELAISLAPKNLDQPTLTATRVMLNRSKFNVALELYKKEKYQECYDLAEKLAHDPSADDVCLSAAAMATQCALGLYQHAADQPSRDAAGEMLNKVAAFMITTWPGKPEADVARMDLGKVLRASGKIEDALKAFESINVKSEKYPDGMYLTGHTHWVRYLDEKKKPEAERNKEQSTKDRTGAIDFLKKALEAAKKGQEPDKPLPKSFIDSQMLLGEISLEGSQADEAVKYFQPLVDNYLKSKSEQFDQTTLRVFTDAVKAYSAKNDLSKAGEVGLKLIELGPDNAAVNGALIEFAKLLDLERKKVAAEVTTNPSQAATEKLAASKKLLITILLKLKERADISSQSVVFIADALAESGDYDNAQAQYKAILEKLDKEPDSEIAKKFKPAEMRIRSQLIDISRRRGDYEGAIKEATALVEKNSKALEPRMLKCRIQQDLAEKSNKPEDFSAAVNGWSELRRMMQNMKPKPPEYYEVLYNAANCLIIEAEKIKTSNKTDAASKALQAEKLLNGVLITSPNLDGPDRVALYHALAKRAAILQGRKPDEKEAPK